jgi:hypothetical protein
MIGTTRLCFVAVLCGLLMMVVEATGDEPKPPDSKSIAERNAMKIPTKIAGTYSGGELIELRVRDRIAYLVKPTGVVDPKKRWLWEFPFWLGFNDGFGILAHRYYLEKALAAGFTWRASMSELLVAAPPRRKSARNSMNSWSPSMACTSGLGPWPTATAA